MKVPPAWPIPVGTNHSNVSYESYTPSDDGDDDDIFDVFDKLVEWRLKCFHETWQYGQEQEYSYLENQALI